MASNLELSRRPFLRGLSFLLATLTCFPDAKGRSVEATFYKLPRWRGFNLPDKFDMPRNKPYQESDFDLIAEWGFDFIRLPVDYRIWTIQPNRYSEKALQEVDVAIKWARERRIHANLALHRAPGYSVAGPVDHLDLWAAGPAGDDARRQFSAQWGMLAARYKGIPSFDLSFNLVNEPPAITSARYLTALSPAVAAIRAQDSDRLIIADGLPGRDGMMPVSELRGLKIAQSFHAYSPNRVTQYRQGWDAKFDGTPPPSWPTENVLNGYLFGSGKKEWQSPLIIRGIFDQATDFKIDVELVSNLAHLVVDADGVTVLDQFLDAGLADRGIWRQSKHMGPENAGWFQAIYNRTYGGIIPAGVRQVRIRVIAGDWMTFSKLQFQPSPTGSTGTPLVITTGLAEYGRLQQSYSIDANGKLVPDSGPGVDDKDSLWIDEIVPWRMLAASGIGVHVGEFGIDNKTPHKVALAWLKDNLENFKRAEFGWALWSLHGNFGILDSGRADVQYEDYKGHKLDRKMLDVLLSA